MASEAFRAKLREAMKPESGAGSCVFRGDTKRTARKSCCGDVEIFDCALAGNEVWHTKCRSCEKFYDRSRCANMKALVLPWNKKGAIRNIIKALRGLGMDVTVIERGEGEWKDEAVAYIHREKPDLFATVQRLYPGWGAEVQAALEEEGTRQIYLDFGVYNHYGEVILDAAGDNARSTLPGSLDMLEGVPYHREAADRAEGRIDAVGVEIAASAEKADANRAALGLDGIPDDFVLVILQRTGDSVLRYDAPAGRQRTHVLAAQFAEEAKKQRQFVVLKPHPRDDVFDRPVMPTEGPYHKLLPRVLPDNNKASAWLLTRCKHVATVNSTMTTSAMIAGKQVVTLGRGWFTGNNVTSEYRSIRGALKGPDAPVSDERVRRFLAHLFARQLRERECADGSKVAAQLHRIHRMFDAGGAVCATARSAGKQKGAIYTAVFGGKDATLRDPEVIEDGVEYHAFTDNPDLASDVWQVHHATPQHACPIMASKEYKVYPWRYLDGYGWSIWIDANQEIKAPLRSLAEDHLRDGTGMVVLEFPRLAQGVYGEAEKNKRLDRVDTGRQAALIRRMEIEGCPMDGLYPGGLLIRSHDHAEVRSAMAFWWQLIVDHGPRDMIALVYTLWRTGLGFKALPVNLYSLTKRHPHAITSNKQWRKHAS